MKTVEGTNRKVTAVVVWIMTFLVLFGLSRVSRDLAERDNLVYRHNGTQNALELQYGLSLDGIEHVRAVKASPNGCVYVLAEGRQKGRTDMDVLVLSLDSGTGDLLNHRWMGSSGFDRGVDIALTQDRQLIVLGNSVSGEISAQNFIGTPAEQKQLDIFIARLSADLEQETAFLGLGGSGQDVATDMQLADNGLIYVAGHSSSRDFLGDLSEPLQPLNVDYGTDGMVIALSAALDEIVHARFIGGTRDDYVYQLEMDAESNIWIAGNTASEDFPVLSRISSPLEPKYSNLFVSKLDSALTLLTSSVVWGSPTSDYLRGMALDNQGRVHVCGHTTSDAYPRSQGATGHTYGGGHFDAFYTILEPGLNALQYSTYIGGGNNDHCQALRLEQGQAYLLLRSNSGKYLGLAENYPGHSIYGTVLVNPAPGELPLLASLSAGSVNAIQSLDISNDQLYLVGGSTVQKAPQLESLDMGAEMSAASGFVLKVQDQ